MINIKLNKQLSILWLLCFLTIELSGQQNLVRNGGFEDLDTCPYAGNQVHFAYPWEGIGTVEVFHSCATTIPNSQFYPPDYFFGVPKNYLGWQMPKTGDGYAGMFIVHSSNPFPVYHEYLQTKLTEKLRENHQYCYRYFVSPTLKNGSNTVLKEFSVLLTDTPFWYNITGPQHIHTYVSAIPTHTCNTGFTTDTSFWYEIKGDFIAKGGEQFLTIGYFRLTDSSDYYPSNIKDGGAYYYIDAVSLWFCGKDTVPEPNNVNKLTPPLIPNVFTPNGDGFNDMFAFKNHEGWELETCIRNRWGRVVFEGKNDQWWDGTINGQAASEGVYYYTVTARNHYGQHEEFHGVVTLVK